MSCSLVYPKRFVFYVFILICCHAPLAACLYERCYTNKLDLIVWIYITLSWPTLINRYRHSPRRRCAFKRAGRGGCEVGCCCSVSTAVAWCSSCAFKLSKLPRLALDCCLVSLFLNSTTLYYSNTWLVCHAAAFPPTSVSLTSRHPAEEAFCALHHSPETDEDVFSFF